MEKKIQDYLHYYIGGSGYANGVYGYITSVDEFGGSEFKLHGEASVVYMDGALIRPILRKIEDCPFEIGEMRLIRDSITYRILKYAAITDYLTKQYIDVFGLIKAGLAIDAATLPK